MGYILTNGEYYIAYTQTGKINKITDASKAHIFKTKEKAEFKMCQASGKTRGYHLEYAKSTKPARIVYPPEVRQRIYHDADGKCALCGKSIIYDDMTLDHIKPLAMGGEDNVNNLQCACFTCNQIKGSALPEEFANRVTDIFLYQMQKKNANRLSWRLTRLMLNSLCRI